MKRTDITKLFPDATDEQISTLLSLNAAEVNNERTRINTLESELNTARTDISRLKEGPTAEKLQAEIDRANGLQAELDALKQAAALREIREKVAGEKKIPIALLTAETEEACAAQADAILAFANPNAYPTVKDGGEPEANGKPTSNSSWLEVSSKISKT